ncbi:MAG: hypothetical protein U9Q67_02725 [Patescibacteria group bacterium]|nr:hypothetical protein [Patescibacteria group bacterium]
MSVSNGRPDSQEAPGVGDSVTLGFDRRVLDMIPPEYRAAAFDEANLGIAVYVLDTVFGKVASQVQVAIYGLSALGFTDIGIPSQLMKSLAGLYVDSLMDKDDRLHAIRSGRSGWIRRQLLDRNLSYSGSPDDRLRGIQYYIDNSFKAVGNYSDLVAEAIQDLYLVRKIALSRDPMPQQYSRRGEPARKDINVLGKVVTEADFVVLMDSLGLIVALATLPKEESDKLVFASNETTAQ